MEPILKVNKLSKIYHTEKEEIIALDNISFDVNEGEFISIVGPSGCGKSTILSILSGLINKSSGSFKLANGYTIAYMLQDDNLLPFRTILDNCLLGLEFNHQLTKDNIEYVKRLLKKYGLEDFINKYPNSLSGGMRQRVSLIRTLAMRPDILLLDEATSALDYQSSLIISEDIYKIIKEEGKTAIMVTHDLRQAIAMSNKIIVLTKRPAKVKNIYDIEFSDKDNSIEKRHNPKFNYYYDLIWRDLDVHI